MDGQIKKNYVSVIDPIVVLHTSPTDVLTRYVANTNILCKKLSQFYCYFGLRVSVISCLLLYFFLLYTQNEDP